MDVILLPLAYEFQGTRQVIYPVVLKDGPISLLIDCGYPGFLPLLQQAADENKFSLNELSGVVITHHDLDHMGALAELKSSLPRLPVYASFLEAPFISGEKKSLRLQQAENLFPSLPADQQPAARQFQERLMAMKPVPVDGSLNDGEPLPGLPGARALFTPGHMPGHLSVFLENEKTLIAADALVLQNGKLALANPQFTLDLPEARKSVGKIRQLKPKRIICYHGGETRQNIPQQLSALLDAYG